MITERKSKNASGTFWCPPRGFASWADKGFHVQRCVLRSLGVNVMMQASYPLMSFTIVLASRVVGIVPNVSHTLRYIALGTLSSPSPSSSYSGSTNSLYVTNWKSYGQIRCFLKAKYHRSIVPNIGSKTPPQPKAYLRSDAAKVTTYQFKIGVFN